MVGCTPPPPKKDPQMLENSFEFLFRKEWKTFFCEGKLIRAGRLWNGCLTYLDRGWCRLSWVEKWHRTLLGNAVAPTGLENEVDITGLGHDVDVAREI
jgi:hypothetical protein